MSQFPNPYSPLRQSLFRPQQMANMMQPPLDPNNPSQRLQAAYALGKARQGGGQSGSMPGSYGSGGASPLANSMLKAKSLVMNSELGDEEDIPADLKQLRDDPSVPMQQFEHLVKVYKANKAPKQPEQPSNDPNAGTMTVTPGSGRDGRPVMSPEGMHRWAMAAKTNNPNAPVTNQADLTRGEKGFEVSGIGMPQPAAPQEQPKPPTGAEQREQRAEHHQQVQENQSLLAENQKRQKEFEAQDPGLLRGHARDPNVATDYAQLKKEEGDISLRLKGLISPQQGQQQQQGQPQQQQDQPHIPHVQFDKQGKVVAGSRGAITPDIAAHYIRRTGSVEAAKAAAAAEGWQS